MKALFKIIIPAAVGLSLIAGCGGTQQGNNVSKPATAKPAVDEKIELTFYYPVQVGGPLTATIESMAQQFTKENPNITIKPVYTGSYGDTTVKVQAAVQGGNPPDIAVLLAADLFTFMDMDSITPLDEFISQEGNNYISDFFPAFTANSKVDGKMYSLPFQRSSVVLYYNKDAYKEAGLDPNKPPQTWEELRDISKKLTKPGKWGIQIPSTGPTSSTWMFQTLALQSGKNLMSDDGKQAYFNTPDNVKALQYWVDLTKKDKSMPAGIVDWATTPSDFIQGKTAMMYHTTGNLTSVKKNAQFDFGVSFLPQNKQFGSPVGGGNLYIFKGIPEKNKIAAWKFMKFMTEPERAAQWSIDTGYVAVRQSAYQTEKMKAYTKEFPAALVAKDQLQYGASELATHNSGKVAKALNDAIQRALTSEVDPATVLKQAQEEADKALAPFKK
ncbi:ABC transporter substrate-binding protein [Paenibacillus sp. Root444D2]|uniref:ABC transporter substrate-binding protein n=1 Tax=Paenibacillus sp. Root444D2 TaxID=1736538 RepID=UPI00070B590E|nr:ABC transporter substrate-binding protein [Paenibacillus sp. Root444D2]KQX45730.1 ABC transporter substrate-binding protein [Paenibacillus sp. Root444D2]